MTIKTNLDDRKELAKRLIPFNHNEKLHYAGTPTFAFEGRGFRILRNGEIDCDDEKTQQALRRFLEEEGLVEPETETIEVGVPIGGMDGIHLRSLIFTLSAQQYLLNRAAGSENFHITEDCVTALKEATLTDAASFFKVYGTCQNGNKGIRLNEESATFCFADTGNAVKNRAMVELFAFLISASRKAKRVQPAVKKPENEKYYFRSWLLRIGMGTKASHESRMALMKDLNGWSAFRTEEEAKQHSERIRARRQRKAQNPEN
ncbi:hypothetical protein [Acidaminococcus fermentans]|jgi:hypothetical protein|uniref:hypothetical protein n=1 Tax=Acidaminococcus fermentans TaxID=905 RepID=UPI002062465F|nr:MAG TPA: hypothetical protein [Caudoviricetes sp.]